MSDLTPAKDVLYSSRYAPYSSTLAYSTSYPYGSLYRSTATLGAPASHEWTEYQPVERKYVDYVPETRVEYRPVERTTKDYVEIKHVTNYEAQPRYERRTEYVPVERVEEFVDYYPRQYSYVSRTPSDSYYRPSLLTSSSLRSSAYYPSASYSYPYSTYGYYRSPYSYRYAY